MVSEPNWQRDENARATIKALAAQFREAADDLDQVEAGLPPSGEFSDEDLAKLARLGVAILRRQARGVAILATLHEPTAAEAESEEAA